MDLNELSDEDLQKLAERLLPIIKRKITLRSQNTLFGKQGQFFERMKIVELTTTGQKQKAKNPLKEEIDGYIITSGDPRVNLRITKKNKNELEFNSDIAGHKIRLFVF